MEESTCSGELLEYYFEVTLYLQDGTIDVCRARGFSGDALLI